MLIRSYGKEEEGDAEMRDGKKKGEREEKRGKERERRKEKKQKKEMGERKNEEKKGEVKEITLVDVFDGNHVHGLDGARAARRRSR